VLIITPGVSPPRAGHSLGVDSGDKMDFLLKDIIELEKFEKDQLIQLLEAFWLMLSNKVTNTPAFTFIPPVPGSPLPPPITLPQPYIIPAPGTGTPFPNPQWPVIICGTNTCSTPEELKNCLVYNNN